MTGRTTVGLLHNIDALHKKTKNLELKINKTKKITEHDYKA